MEAITSIICFSLDIVKKKKKKWGVGWDLHLYFFRRVGGGHGHFDNVFTLANLCPCWLPYDRLDSVQADLSDKYVNYFCL